MLRPHNPFPPAGIIGIGALSESPVQRAVWARLGITDVSARLCRGPGTTLLARPSQVALPRRFCEQRMGAAPSARLVAEDAGTGVYELASAKKL